MMKKIIIDTNALMAISEFKIDLFSEIKRCCDFKYKIYVLEGTLRELDNIQKEQRGKEKQAARLALSLLKHQNVEVLEDDGTEKCVDDRLVYHSQQGDLVLTQDAGLKKRLQKPYLTIRQKKMVVLAD